MKVKHLVFIVIFALFLSFFGYYFYKQNRKQPAPSQNEIKTQDEVKQAPPSTIKLISEPLPDAASRITKKPFGIYINPATSPIQPEKFTGYHTGTDFEIVPSELKKEIPVNAICDGKIIVKQAISGYGGTIVQSCTIDNETVTVLYGHVDLASMNFSVGETAQRGQFLVNLGSDKSAATGGERKHLHLGIHKGTAIEYRGYVLNESQLSHWINYETLN